jgi:hypothetical protein
MLVLATFAASNAQIGIPNTFTAGTRIVSADVNANFSAVGDNALNRTGGTMTGVLTTQGIGPDANNTRDIASTGTRYRDLWLGRNAAVGGTLSVTGAVTGASFAGSGAALTGIPETAITDGALLARVAADETVTGNWTLGSANPMLWFDESDGAANNQVWRFLANGEQFSLYAWNDALSASGAVFTVERTGTTVDEMRVAAPFAVGTGGTAIASIVSGTTTWDIPSTTEGTTSVVDITVTGAAAGSPCMASHTSGDAQSAFSFAAMAMGANIVRVYARNETGSGVNPSTGTLRVTCINH